MGEPLPICYLNGDFLPLREARISPLDRGFLYSDGAYEVTPVYAGRPFRFTQHHDRLTRSLREIRMEDPLAREAWRDLYRELIARNAHPGDLYVYGQGKNISMADWAALILRIGEDEGYWPRREIVSTTDRFRPGASDVLALRVGYEKLHRETGWEPLVSWETGVARTIAWYAGNRERWIGRVDWRQQEAATR